MITCNRIGDVISGSVNGKQFGVTFSQEKWDLMKAVKAKADQADTMEELQAAVAEFEPLTKESYKDMVETITPFIVVNPSSNKFYLKYKDKVSTKALPQAFVDRILLCIDKGIEIMPLIKCWVRFLRNPHYTDKKAVKFANYINKTYTETSLVTQFLKDGLSNEIATQKATAFQTPITDEGLLMTYKVSAEILKKYVLNEDEEIIQRSRYSKSVDPDTGLINYDAPQHVEDRLFEPAVMHQDGDEFFRSTINGVPVKGHFIQVGQLHWLESWDMVNCDDNKSSVKGLHAGNLDYIRNYQNDGTVTHNILIDPMDIGAITDDGSGALRVRRYFVHSSFAGVCRSIYHSSKFAAITDAEYAQMVEDAVNKTLAQKNELDEQYSEKEALREI